MNVLTLDFETYYDSDYNLKKLTTPEYVAQPMTRWFMVRDIQSHFTAGSLPKT
jgi:hypothetical protein